MHIFLYPTVLTPNLDMIVEELSHTKVKFPKYKRSSFY